MLNKLYGSKSGRFFLKILTSPGLSKAAGKFLDTRYSVVLIPPFILTSHIEMSEVKPTDWGSFNQFFTRKLVDGARTPDMDPDAFISPCDGLLKICPIKNGVVVNVKDVNYTIADLVKSHKIASAFDGGLCLIFRLTPSHYHRYAYPDDGVKSRDVEIPGVLHTVRPVATEATDVFIQNARNYSIIKTVNFGPVLFMQVGAMLVGRIANNHPDGAAVLRGQDAGAFEYGGSTVIMLIKKDKVEISEKIKEACDLSQEYPVKLGMKIGTKIKSR